jgi:hypothetical protein
MSTSPRRGAESLSRGTDECDRGYTAAELSTWRNTLDHFDAIKVGLTAHRWRCAKGHVWRAAIGRIVKGQWCAKCAKDLQRLDFGALREFARVCGVECFSKKYVNGRTPMRWRCAQGHAFVRTAQMTKRLSDKAAEQLCPVCRRETLHALKQSGEPPRKKPAGLLRTTSNG